MFHSMHTWLSMVLLLPFVLHVWRNWGQFMLYFRNPPCWWPAWCRWPRPRASWS
ncbi:hypothetical protein RAA17_12975 [Komagataeibacter rhaeticus]|nr:hypothetical protein [Komagataeibacter rhaeticus]